MQVEPDLLREREGGFHLLRRDGAVVARYPAGEAELERRWTTGSRPDMLAP